MKKNIKIIFALLLINIWLTWFTLNVSAACVLDTSAPILTISWENEMRIKFKTNSVCADTINEFKVYYLKNWNYSPISTVIPGENSEFYYVKWDISDVADWEYKVKILQDWDQRASTSSSFFTIDKTKPEIRDDFWITPTWWEILKWNIILKWNKDSVSDSYVLDENPINFYYSVDNEDIDNKNWEKIWENIENSWIYVWNSTKSWSLINSKTIFLKVIVKDLYWNENFLISEKTFEVDNKAPKKLNFTKIWDKNFMNEKQILNFTPKISIWWFDKTDWEVRVIIFDSKTEKIFWSLNVSENIWNWEVEIQLDPMNDADYELKILSIDKAWNKTESDDILKIQRDSFSPKAPTISYAAIVNNNLRVSVSDFSEEDKETWKFILMNWTQKIWEQSSKNNIIELDMLPQWIYNLYVKHKDLAWNLSDSSNVKKVIFDTVWPKEVSFSVPSWVSIYWDYKIDFFAIDNVWVEKIEIYLDWKKIWNADKNLKFNLNSKTFLNWEHKIYAIAKDFNWNDKKSPEKIFRIFNPLKDNHWSNNYVKNLFDKKILSWENNSWIVDPDSFLNKAKSLKIISEFFSDKIKNMWDKKILFSDVENWVWFEQYVQDWYKNKIISWNKKSKNLEKIEWKNNVSDIENVQCILKSLWYNLKITWFNDFETKRAIANFQKKNWLKQSWLLWSTTIKFLNFEPNVVKWIFYEDEWIYFNPWQLVNRAEVLKMILNAAKVDLENRWWPWYQKYLDFAKNNWIMTWKDNWDFAMWDPVTIWEMAKMILKTKDVIDN
jgi:hypothetical protein